MLADHLQKDENDARAYLVSLAEGLSREARDELHQPEAAELVERADKLRHTTETAMLRSFGAWQHAVHAYESLAAAVAGARNARARVARSYDSMVAMHGDAAAQSEGRSPYSVWDAREHGRRRQLEASLARCYSAPSALLVNSGASALAVALGARRLPRGSTVLTGRSTHRDAEHLLTRFIAPLGVKLVRVPPANARTVLDALSALQPSVAFFETAVIAPGGDVPAGIRGWSEASPRTLFLVDNTAQSVLTRWFGGAAPAVKRLLVLESATKYLAHHCTAGLLYGPEELIAESREYAKYTGQQLQEKAFNFVRPAEIEHLGWKLSRHSHNAGVFLDELSAVDGVDARGLDAAAGEESRRLLFREGRGGVVFVRLRGHGSGERAHHELLAAWQATARRRGGWIPVRAGFGWNDTTATVQAAPLHESKGSPHLRISTGIEPEHIARELAGALAAACVELRGAS
ncbi:MAG: PLP-dependent transferase [Polyangiaceae bacterium]